MLSGIFHLIPLYWGSLMPKWKAVFPNQVKFSHNFGFLRRFLRLAGKIVGFLKSLFEPFIVLKTTVSIPRFQCKNRFEKWTPQGWDIWEKQNGGCGLVWRATFKNIFANISAQGGPFFKPIFALKPWDREGRFEYNKKYKIRRFFPRASKTQNCRKTWPDWEEWLFI